MEDHHNTSKNFVNTIASWTSRGFLPKVKPYIPKEVFTASELQIQQKLISEQRPGAIDYFHDHIYTVKIADVTGTKEYKEKFERLDKKGFFDNLFLSELSEYGERFQHLYIADSTDDIDSFIDTLEKIATRSPGSTTELVYGGKVFKIQVILIAKHQKIRKSLEPYLYRVNQAIKDGQNSIYLLARNQKINYIEPLIEKITKETKAKMIWKKKLKTADSNGNLVATGVCLLRVHSS